MALTSTILTTTPTNAFLSNGNNAVTTMYLCNTGNITAYFNIYAVPAGTQADAGKLIYYRVPLTSYDTYIIESEKLILQDGDSIKAEIINPSQELFVGLYQTLWGNVDRVNAAVWATDRDEYLIVGDNGKVALSKTGESWEYQNGLIALGWPSGTPVNGISRLQARRYVAVGDNGWMAVSSDGKLWSNQTALSSTGWGTTNINAIVNNGSVFLVVGDSGKVATSLDGIVWTIQPQLTTTGWSLSNIWSAIWTGTMFMIGGSGGKLATSVDGVTWTYIDNLASNPAWGIATRITSIAYSGSSSAGYMVGSADNNKIATSSNGTTWVYDSGLADRSSSATVGVGAIAFRSGYGFYIAMASSDIFLKDLAGDWNRYQNLNLAPWGGSGIMDLIWNNERAEFLAVGYNAKVATSYDGIAWTFRSTTAANGQLTELPNVVVTVSSIGI